MASCSDNERDSERDSERDNERIKETLSREGIPIPEGTLLDCRYSMRNGDWHVLTAETGWWYLRTDIPKEHQQWVRSAYGPTT